MARQATAKSIPVDVDDDETSAVEEPTPRKRGPRKGVKRGPNRPPLWSEDRYTVLAALLKEGVTNRGELVELLRGHQAFASDVERVTPGEVTKGHAKLFALNDKTKNGKPVLTWAVPPLDGARGRASLPSLDVLNAL